MYRRPFLQAGDHVILVPMGGFITLSYDVTGGIDGVLYNNQKLETQKEILECVKRCKTVPTKLHIQNGRTSVKGVLYASKMFHCLGNFPKGSNETYINDYIENPEDYNFFATSFETDSVSYSGYAGRLMNQWLKMAGFNTIDGFIVPSEPNAADSVIRKYLVTDTSFKPNQILYYLVFHGSEYRYIPSNMHGYMIDDVDTFMNQQGQMLSDVTLNDGTNTVTKRYGYEEIVQHTVVKGQYILLNDMDEIIYTDVKGVRKYNDTVQCPCCKKMINVTPGQPVVCLNSRCKSRMYSNIKHTVSVLGLPEMSYEKYCEVFKDFYNVLVSDILDVPEYQEKTVYLTIDELLSAIMPVSEIRDRSIFKKFADNCVNNLETARYYVANPDEIWRDMDNIKNSISISEFIAWFRDPTNVSVFEAFLNCPSIHLSLQSMKAINSAPTLRGQHVAITGKFKHGDSQRISSILSEYAATTSLSLDTNTSVLVTGDLREDVSGVMVREAKERLIPVLSEGELFAMYDIDFNLE